MGLAVGSALLGKGSIFTCPTISEEFSKYVLGQATGGVVVKLQATAADDLELCLEPILRLQYRTASHRGCYYYYLQVKSVLLDPILS